MKFIESKFVLRDYKNYNHQDRKVYLLEEQDCDNLLNKFSNGIPALSSIMPSAPAAISFLLHVLYSMDRTQSKAKLVK